MQIFNYLLTILFKIMNYLGRYRLIYDRVDDKKYLERYYIFLKDRKTFPFNIFIHKFLKSDSDDLHDHPWSFISIVLWPGYYEHTPTGKSFRKPLSIKFAKAEQLHRIELINNYCWTIFIPGKQCREWGFVKNNKWIHNEEYLKLKNN